MADNIAVSVRVRPLNSKEESKGAVWDINSETNAIAPQVRPALGPVAVVACSPSREGGNYKSSHPSPTPDIRSPYPPHAQAGSSAGTTDSTSYQLDNVFDPSCRTKDVYDRTTRGIIESVLNGFNGTVFAYGQTSSGKTHTMQGPDIDDEIMKGIIPRMVGTVFENIANSPEYVLWTVKVGIVEIYNERIRDLLDPTKTNLKIREDPQKGIYIQDLTERFIGDESEVA